MCGRRVDQARDGEVTGIDAHPDALGLQRIIRPEGEASAADPDVLRTIARERDACLAVGALVAQSGAVRIGDELTRL